MSDSCDPVDCSPPGSSVHGILQARYWSGLPFPSPGDPPDPARYARYGILNYGGPEEEEGLGTHL